MISTFSPGVVSFRTVDDMAGTTPVQKIRLSLSILIVHLYSLIKLVYQWILRIEF